MKPYQRQFIEFALGKQVLKFGEFTLKSGRKSPYFFNAGLFNTGRDLALLGRFYAEALVDSGIEFDLLFGPAYKGIPIATTTAVALAEANIRTYCTGGQMRIHSFSYVGDAAASFVKNINADVLFFSCHGLTNEGQMTDRAVEEADLRKVMFSVCKKKILLCDGGKIGKTYFYNMGSVADIDDVISEAPLPTPIEALLKR